MITKRRKNFAVFVLGILIIILFFSSLNINYFIAGANFGMVTTYFMVLRRGLINDNIHE